MKNRPTSSSTVRDAEFFGDHEEVGPTAEERPFQDPLYLLQDGLFCPPLLQLIFELRREQLQEFIVVLGEG